MLKWTVLALAAAVMLPAGNEAGATPIGVVNGETQLNVTSFDALGEQGVTVTPGGTAEVRTVDRLPSPIVFYDVTSIDLDTAQIFHEGAQLDLSTDATVRLSNFIVDAGAGAVLADVSASGTTTLDVAVFDINKACTLADPCIGLDETITIDGLELTLSDDAGELLANVLEIPDLAGAAVAVANSSFTPVPEPGTAALLGLGLVGLAATERSRRRT